MMVDIMHKKPLTPFLKEAQITVQKLCNEFDVAKSNYDHMNAGQNVRPETKEAVSQSLAKAIVARALKAKHHKYKERLQDDIAREIRDAYEEAVLAQPPPATSAAEPLDPEGPASPKPNLEVDIRRLPATSHEIHGRERELRALSEAWNGNTAVLVLDAFGGVGKTALVKCWLDNLGKRYGGAERVYAWSFYRQGSEDSASAQAFITSAFEWFGCEDASLSLDRKVDDLVRKIRKRRTLLVLDGLEPLQDMKGVVKDPNLRKLLEDLADDNQGLCIVTSRRRMPELESAHGPPRLVHMSLENLSPEAGARLMKSLGVRGPQPILSDVLPEVSREYDGHCLALTLLASYLVAAFDGDVRRIPRRGDILIEAENRDKDPGERIRAHIARIMREHEGRLGAAQLETLRIVSLFDRPAERHAVLHLLKQAPIPQLTSALRALSEPEMEAVFQELRRDRLLAPDAWLGDLDAHPLVREHFRKQMRQRHPEAWRQGHRELFAYRREQTGGKSPNSIMQMESLYQAIAHGCQADQHEEALDDVYRRLVLRDEKHCGQYGSRAGSSGNHSTQGLSAYASDLMALESFFDRTWDVVSAKLPPKSQIFVLTQAAYCMRAVGRFKDAISTLEIARNRRAELGENTDAALDEGDISYAHMMLGDLWSAREAAERAVHLAGPCEAGEERTARGRCVRLNSYSRLGTVHHQLGDMRRAEEAFRSAEAYELEYPEIFALGGFQDIQFCEYLLDLGQYEVVERRIRQALESHTDKRKPLAEKMSAFLLGRVALCAGDDEAARIQFHTAVESVRSMGRPDYLPVCLLARSDVHRMRSDIEAARADLDKARRIANRCEMRLCLADCDIGEIELDLAAGRLAEARSRLDATEALITRLNYGRREKAIKRLRERLD